MYFAYMIHTIIKYWVVSCLHENKQAWVKTALVFYIIQISTFFYWGKINLPIVATPGSY